MEQGRIPLQRKSRIAIAVRMMQKQRVLFLCTHNSARSQMAEGLLRALYGDRYEVLSAGTEPTSVHPLAVQVMAEIGIDISNHRSKSVEEFHNLSFDLVVTVCDRAKEQCPWFPGARRLLHHSFEDPASVHGSELDRLAAFRRVRDQLRHWIIQTFGTSEQQ